MSQLACAAPPTIIAIKPSTTLMMIIVAVVPFLRLTNMIARRNASMLVRTRVK